MTTPDLGPAVASDNAFKARARLHQSCFRAEVLGHPSYRGYGSRLEKEAALAGDNFYRRWPGMLDAVNGRVGVSDKKLCWDMLASDHIPYNFFIPMREQSWAIELVRGWVGPSASKVTAIEIEWAPEPAADYLRDNTSFDAYVAYETADGKRGAIGIETKFTEGPYSWGKTEHAQMHDDGSRYLNVTRTSKAFVEDALVQLRTPKLKQLWRNQLLGEAMRQRGDVDAFTSVLLYPAGNTHYACAASAYAALLRPDAGASRFVPVTFEEHFARCRSICEGAETAAWLDYLERRYVVA
jgi:hypothetical protein